MPTSDQEVDEPRHAHLATFQDARSGKMSCSRYAAHDASSWHAEPIDALDQWLLTSRLPRAAALKCTPGLRVLHRLTVVVRQRRARCLARSARQSLLPPDEDSVLVSTNIADLLACPRADGVTFRGLKISSQWSASLRLRESRTSRSGDLRADHVEGFRWHGADGCAKLSCAASTSSSRYI